MAWALKSPKFSEGFLAKPFTKPGGRCRVCDQLVQNPLIGWWRGNQGGITEVNVISP